MFSSFPSIPHVIKLGSFIKMVWINTVRNVTFMQNEHSFSYFSKFKFIGKSVTRKMFFLDCKFTIPKMVSWTYPKPAGRSLFHILKKSYFWFRNFVFVGAFQASFRFKSNRFFTIKTFIDKPIFMPPFMQMVKATGPPAWLLAIFTWEKWVVAFGRIAMHGKLILSRAIPRTATTVAGFLLVLILLNIAQAGTYTSRSGLFKPDLHETGWGEKVSSDFDIIDSSFAILSGTQTFTGFTTFSSSITVLDGQFRKIWISTPTYVIAGDKLAVNGDVRVSGVIYVCDSSFQNCANFSSTDLTIGGQSVCLENGTNCPASTGGSAFTLEVLAGVQRTSPTVTVGFPASQFSGSTSGSSMTVTLNGSSVTLQGNTNVSLLNSTQTFTANKTISYGHGLLFQNQSGTQGAYLYGGGNGLSDLSIFAPGGIGLGSINTFAGAGPNMPEVMISSQGFAVFGSSSNLGLTYSGFVSTTSVDSSQLWSLPRKDGTSGQALVTNGTGNLSFTTITGGGGSSFLEILAGVARTSPTVTVGFPSPQFTGAVTGSSTTVSLNSSSVTLQGNAITFTGLQTQINTVINGSGTIVASPQFQMGYYSSVGTTNTIRGDTATTTDGAGSVSVSTLTVAETVTSSIAVSGTYRVTGTGAGRFNALEGAVFAAQSGRDILYADSTDHQFKMMNNGNIPYRVLGSSASSASGKCAQYNADGSVYPAAGGCITTASIAADIDIQPQYQVTYMDSSSSPSITSAENFTNNGSTVTIGLQKMTQVQVTTQTADQVLFNYVTSTMTISSMTVAELRVTKSAAINSGTGGSYQFTVSTTSTFYHLAVSTNGHINVKGTVPTLSSCGTSPSIVGSDNAYTVTVGGTTTGCTITFNVPYNSAPTCVISEQTMSLVNALSYTVSSTAVALSQTGLNGNKLDVHCIGRD